MSVRAWVVLILFFLVTWAAIVLNYGIDVRQHEAIHGTKVYGADTLEYVWENDLSLSEVRAIAVDARDMARSNNSVMASWMLHPPWKEQLQRHAAAINYLLAQSEE